MDHRLLRGQLHFNGHKNSRKHIKNTKLPITLSFPSHVLQTKLTPISKLKQTKRNMIL